MSGYYQRQDLRHYVATKIESAYAVATADGDFNREFRLSDDEIAEAIKRDTYNLCGGEFHTDSTDEQQDGTLAVRMLATNDALGWALHKLFGGGDGYSVTGVSDPYLQAFKPIQAPDYQPDSFSVIEGRKNGTEFWLYKGGLMSSGRLIGTIDGDKRLRFEGNVEFDGSRTAVVDFDPPACVGQKAYRMGDCVFSVGPHGGSAHSGLRTRGFTVSVDNKPETLDECDRTGLYVAGRDRGDRSDGFMVTWSVLGKKGDAVDLNFHAGDKIFWQLACPSPGVSNRDLLVRMNRGVIVRKSQGWSTSVGKSTHEFEIKGLLDETSPTTEAQSPIYATLETSTATYAA